MAANKVWQIQHSWRKYRGCAFGSICGGAQQFDIAVEL
jgi:hypothetical protein